MELKTIQSLLEEITYLKDKASLLDEIMGYWNMEDMTFDIPKEWKGNGKRLGEEMKKSVPKSPRHCINDLISKKIPAPENYKYVNEEELNKKMLD